MDLNKPAIIAENASSLLKQQLLSIESEIIEGVIDTLLSLDTEKGALQATTANTKAIAAMQQDLNEILQNAGFNDFVTDYLSNFDDLTDFTIVLHKDINNLNVGKRTLNKYKQLAIQQVLENMTGAGLHAKVVLPLQETLQENIFAGGGLKDVLKSLRQKLQTDKQSLGLVTSHLTQISRDGLMQYNGVTHQVVQQQYGLDAIRYIGSLVNDSRPQCERWVKYNKNGKKGVILLSELQKEINWAKRNGSGFIRTTTVANFCQNRGGHNCRHQAIPVRV